MVKWGTNEKNHPARSSNSNASLLITYRWIFIALYLFLDIICFTLNSSCFISPMYHVAWHRLLRVMTDSTTKSVQRSITMTHEFHNEHKQISFDQQSREVQAKTFKKKDTFIFGMGIQSCSLSTLLPLLYQHVLGCTSRECDTSCYERQQRPDAHS